ncbi:HNH endonuclease [Flavobacterium sp. ZT3R18]|uniref:HNH endonuclease n=1 Tax=Flavobacterium sp. ZT3R18 TaxID=2594429 RepID=UPI00117AAF65|nr:HNH endonuclease [Flavobacterium sp. ZT3R18]TRX32557.1 HNH endonuclease [Flavobacterium sp. ZT3R18]
MSTNKRCIFCKSPSDSSKSEEHIIPESMGSRKKILPKGIVCDKCNNYFAIKVENPILSHKAFRNIRGYYQVPNKKGKMPSVIGFIDGTNIEISLNLNKDNTLNIQPENESDRDRFKELYEDKLTDSTFPALLFIVDINPPKRDMSRFLAKMALETLVYRFVDDEKWVEEIINESHYDLIRNYARYGKGVDEWPYHKRRIFPEETQMRHPDTGEWVQIGFGSDTMLTSRKETYFVFLYYGMEFAINLGGPSVKGYEEWLIKHNNISPLVERIGVERIEKIVNKQTEYFLEGVFDIRKGIYFDKENLGK